MAVRNEAAEQNDAEVGATAVTRVIDLRDVLELFFGQGSRQIHFVGEQFSEETLGNVGNQFAIKGIVSVVVGNRAHTLAVKDRRWSHGVAEVDKERLSGLH